MANAITPCSQVVLKDALLAREPFFEFRSGSSTWCHRSSRPLPRRVVYAYLWHVYICFGTKTSKPPPHYVKHPLSESSPPTTDPERAVVSSAICLDHQSPINGPGSLPEGTSTQWVSLQEGKHAIPHGLTHIKITALAVGSKQGSVA